MFDTWTPGFIPVVTKAGQVLAVASLGLYLGQQGFRVMTQRGSVVVPLFMLGGLAASFAPKPWIAPEGALFIATALAGMAAATSWPRLPFGLALGAAGGAALGLAAHPVDAEWPDAMLVAAANLLGASLLLISITGFANWAQRRSGRFWLRIGIRVIGAWTLAISVMMLALDMRRVDPILVGVECVITPSELSGPAYPPTCPNAARVA